MIDARLLQLASPSLPVGAYSYSQGLEAAVEAGIVRDAASARGWIGEVLELSVRPMEAPIFLRLAAAWNTGDVAGVHRWNDELVATRETAELRAETLQMGHSLRLLLRDLGAGEAAILQSFGEIAFATAYTHATAAWRIDARAALAAYLFGWLENQMLAALKCVPLGQTEGQRLLLELAGRIEAVVQSAGVAPDDELHNLAPGLALVSARHETQYSRLFRS